MIDYGASTAPVLAAWPPPESHAHAREDLLQDIRLAIWTALPRFRSDASVRTFVFRIAHNRALTHLWRKKRAGKSEDPGDLVDARENPERSTIQNANRVRLVEAIRGLPIPFRQVITLALEDLPHSEIALILGISENNVAVRITRARKLLKEILGSQT